MKTKVPGDEAALGAWQKIEKIAERRALIIMTYRGVMVLMVPQGDEAALKAWKQIVKIAKRYALIGMAYGSVMLLMVPREQRRAGIRTNVLEACGRYETGEWL